MESRAKALGHPIHQMLIPFPFGLLSTAVVFDIVYLFLNTPTRAEHISTAAFWMMGAGVVGGIAASPFGLIDYLAIPAGTRAKRVGLTHGLGNVVVLLLFAVSIYLRYASPARPFTREPTTFAIVLALAGFALAGLTGWLGGELVDRLGVGVDDGAHLDAPSSLRTDSARGDAPGQIV